MKNNKSEIYNSIIKQFFDQMDKDHWYIKFNRWFKIKQWLFICNLRLIIHKIKFKK